MLTGFLIINALLFIFLGYLVYMATHTKGDAAGGAAFSAFVVFVGIIPIVNVGYGVIWMLVRLIWG